ncbi:MAG: hypothetical protein O2822_07780 [Chloroflexi bacterium]|nr:hypothetical protein [Chloroflexota bacterium]
MLRLAAFARGALRVARWFALATLIAGGVVLLDAWDFRQPARSLLLLVICLAPGSVLLHLVLVLASLPARLRFDRGLPSRSNVMLLGVGITYLLRPWYWLAVGLSAMAAAVLLPLAILVLLGAR